MRKGALLLALLFAASLPSVADAAKAKRTKAKAAPAPAAAQADPDAALKLVLTEGLPGFLLPTPLLPLWFEHRAAEKKATQPEGRRARRASR